MHYIKQGTLERAAACVARWLVNGGARRARPAIGMCNMHACTAHPAPPTPLPTQQACCTAAAQTPPACCAIIEWVTGTRADFDDASAKVCACTSAAGSIVLTSEYASRDQQYKQPQESAAQPEVKWCACMQVRLEKVSGVDRSHCFDCSLHSGAVLLGH